MQFLKIGSRGSDVKILQEKLKAFEFNPGAIDGVFGPATEAAVLAFQKSQKLLADGIVGPQTCRVLDLMSEQDVKTELEKQGKYNVLSKVTINLVSKMFPAAPLKNISSNLPHVLNGLKEVGLTDKKMVNMALSTIRAETELFMPITELVSRYNTSPSGNDFDLYDYRRDLGNQGPPDGSKFKGRGFVQLTGRFNYKEYSQKLMLGNKLLENPDLACNPEIAGRLLAYFLYDKERSIKEALNDYNLNTARRLINGSTNGLDRFSESYRIGNIMLS